MVSKTQVELLDHLDQVYAVVDKESSGKVVKATECLRCTKEALNEFQQQASVNQKALADKRKEQENLLAIEQEKKEKQNQRMKVMLAYALYYFDTLEVGTMEDSEVIELWFAKYRRHETNDIIDNETFNKYLREVDIE